MGLDLRWPIGLMFSIIGAMLAIAGLVNGPSERALGININLIWGIILLVFGVFMVIMAARGKKNYARHDDSDSGKNPTKPL